MREHFSLHNLIQQREVLIRWVVALIAAVAIGTVVEYFGLPGAHFFGGVIVGVCIAIFRLAKGNIPPWAFEGALAVTGVVLGTYVTPASLESVATNIIPVTLISIGTLAISILMGLLLSRVTTISLPTALLGMLAGGSAMNVVTGDHIKADVRMVTFMHLVRLMMVLIATPILIHFVFAPHIRVPLFAAASPESAAPFMASFLFTIAVSLIGFWLAWVLPYSGSMLLTPLFLAAALMLMPALRDLVPPEGFREFAAIIIGLQVGSRFNSDALKRARKHFFIVLLLMSVVIAVCGLFAWILAATTTMTALTAYLATNPGGRTAVVALAFTTGADTTTVLAIQTLRLLMMTVLAPLVIRFLVRGHAQKQLVIEGEEFLE